MPAADLAVTVITGPPGVGKTALALKAAHLARAEFPDGQLYAGLGGVGEARAPLDILGELLRSLGVPPRPDSRRTGGTGFVVPLGARWATSPAAGR